MRWMRLWIMLLLAVALSVSALGCNAARKPAPQDNQVPAPTTPAPNRALPASPAESNALARELADRAAGVNGVKKATVVLSGNTAIVGLDMDKGIEKKETNDVKTEVGRVVKNADNRIKNVLVSTDADIVSRIKRVASGIAEGKPLSSFTDEIKEIIRRITPSAR